MKNLISFLVAISISLTISFSITYSQMQSDESDALWSIVIPLSASQDVDMGKLLVGTTKDMVVTDFVQNTGSWKFRVDNIYFQGVDANAFSLVSGFPEYIVEPNNAHFAEFRFTPQRVGIHNAEIVIITQADTLIQNIRGEGIEKKLEVVENLIDFGEVNVGNSKDTLQTVTIKNIGSIPFTITETKHNYPNDVDFTTLDGGGNFTLQPDETRLMDLRFAPSDVGRTSGTLEFHYNGVGSPAVVQLFGEGIFVGLAKAELQTTNLEAKPGDEIDVPIILNSQENIHIAGIETISADLTFNPTLLYPIGYDIERIDDKTAKIRIEDIPADAQAGEVLKTIKFIVGLGNAESCDLILSDAETMGGDADISLINGKFNLLGVCYEGGARILNPSSESGIISITPNPAEEVISLQLKLIEKGYTDMGIYNTMGNKESTILSEKIDITGDRTININVSGYSSGLYFIVLVTPSHRFTQEIMILK